jgi:hypothetical protein
LVIIQYKKLRFIYGIRGANVTGFQDGTWNRLRPNVLMFAEEGCNVKWRDIKAYVMRRNDERESKGM